MILHKADLMVCPHCGAELNGTAIEYVIEGASPGPDSQGLATCEHCDEELTATLMDHAGNVRVSMA